MTASGTYSVEATVGECIMADEITLTFLPNPTVDLGGDVVCARVPLPSSM